MSWRDLREKYGGGGSNSEKLNRAITAEVPAGRQLLDASETLHRELDRPGPQRSADDLREFRAAAAMLDAILDNLRAGVKRRWRIGQGDEIALVEASKTLSPVARPMPVIAAAPTTAVMGSRREWTPPAAVVARMGKVADEELARECRVSPSMIAACRRRLNIAAYQQDKGAVEWTGEMDAMLGTRPDEELGALWHRSGEAVRRRRVKLGVQAGRAKVEWTEGRLRVLAIESDNATAAAQLQIAISAVKTARSRYKLEIEKLRSER